MRTHLNHRDFKVTRSRTAIPDKVSSQSQLDQLPVNMFFWYVLSGFLVILAATVGGLYGFTALSAVCLTILLSLSFLSFVLGSLGDPNADDEIENAEASWEEINLSLNHALWTILSGASLAAGCVSLAIVGHFSCGALGPLLLAAAGCLISQFVANGIWQCRNDVRPKLVVTLKIDRHAPVMATAPSYASILEALEKAAEQASTDFSPQQSSESEDLVRRTLESLGQTAASTRGPSKVPAGSHSSQRDSLEFVVRDDLLLEEVLEQTVGSHQRLIG